MDSMFRDASAFDQDLGDWAVQSVTNMEWMFYGASDFDQDLGWCVDDDDVFDPWEDGLTMQDAFDGTKCASTSCGMVLQGVDCPFPTPAPTQRNFMDDSRIRTAVRAWAEDRAAAEATYGHISTWETSGVTDMSMLFCGDSHDHSGVGYCNTAAASFNEDIGAWDTSGVTRMYGMFWGASSFNQNIGGWSVENVN